MPRTREASEPAPKKRAAGTGEDRPRRRPRVRVDELPDGCLAYAPEDASVHHLNAAAALVLELCDGKRTAAEIAETVRGAYRLRKAPEAEVRAAVRRMRSAGLLASAAVAASAVKTRGGQAPGAKPRTTEARRTQRSGAKPPAADARRTQKSGAKPRASEARKTTAKTSRGAASKSRPRAAGTR